MRKDNTGDKIIMRCGRCVATITVFAEDCTNDPLRPLPDYMQTGCDNCGGAMYGQKDKEGETK